MGERVHPSTHEIVKAFPNNPPERGDIVLVEGERYRVKRVKVRWEGRTWHLVGDIFVDRLDAGGEKYQGTCPRCGSPRWVRASVNGGATVFPQCVPCGAAHLVTLDDGNRALDAGGKTDG